MGSAEAAHERYAELAQFAASTPFALQGVAEASKILETLTEGALSTGEGLRTVGDAAAISGVRFEELAVTVGRAFSGLQSNRAIGESLARLQELGLLSGEVRTQIEQLQKEARGKEAWDVLNRQLQRTRGGMEELSNTLEGKTSTLVDNIGLLTASLLENAGVVDILKGKIDFLNNAIDERNEKKKLEVALAKESTERTKEEQILVLSALDEKLRNQKISIDLAKKELKELESIGNVARSDIYGNAQRNVSIGTRKREISAISDNIIALNKEKQAEIETLNVLVKREREEQKKAESIRKTNQAKQEAQRLSKVKTIADEKNAELERKSIERLLKDVALREEQNKKILERNRIQEAEEATVNQEEYEQRALFERELNNEIALLTADRFEREEILLQQYVDSYIMAASEIYDNQQELNDKLFQIDKIYTERSNKLSDMRAQQEINNTLSVASTAVGAFREIFGDLKAFAIADIIINTARGIIRSFAELPPPFNAIQAGFIGVTGAAQLAKASGANFRDGGLIQGQGTGTSDSVPINASNGEFVVRASEVPQNIDTLEAINNGETGRNTGNTIIVVTDPFVTEEEMAIKQEKILRFGIDAGIIPRGVFA